MSRLEANYAHQQSVDMIPLMMQRHYNARGWLGLILGTRLYYRYVLSFVQQTACCMALLTATWAHRPDHSFFDAEGDGPPAFEARVDVVVRELGDRGKLGPAPAAVRGAILSSRLYE